MKPEFRLGDYVRFKKYTLNTGIYMVLDFRTSCYEVYNPSQREFVGRQSFLVTQSEIIALESENDLGF